MVLVICSRGLNPGNGEARKSGFAAGVYKMQILSRLGNTEKERGKGAVATGLCKVFGVRC